MKKSLVLILALLVTFSAALTCAFAAEYTKFSSKFKKSFQDCDPYEETTTSEFEGETFTSSRKIIGWLATQIKYCDGSDQRTADTFS